MKVTVERIDDAFHFKGTNEAGATMEMDTAPRFGGDGRAPSPMETVAMALGGCSAVDVVEILRKARQPLEDLRIQIEAERATDQTPAVFTRLHVHFVLTGNLDTAKVERAINLSMEKHCSVAKMLEKTASISHSFSVEGTEDDSLIG